MAVVPAARNGVGASHPATIPAVGPSWPVSPGQGRRETGPQAVIAAGACVAAEDASTMNSFLDNGATVSHSRTATAIGDDANTIQNFARSRGAAGHDVIVHGDADGNFRVNGMITNSQQIADAILENPDYSGEPISLVTCNGACGAAQELGEILGVSVTASLFDVDLDPITGLLREWP